MPDEVVVPPNVMVPVKVLVVLFRAQLPVPDLERLIDPDGPSGILPAKAFVGPVAALSVRVNAPDAVTSNGVLMVIPWVVFKLLIVLLNDEAMANDRLFRTKGAVAPVL